MRSGLKSETKQKWRRKAGKRENCESKSTNTPTTCAAAAAAAATRDDHLANQYRKIQFMICCCDFQKQIKRRRNEAACNMQRGNSGQARLRLHRQQQPKVMAQFSHHFPPVPCANSWVMLQLSGPAATEWAEGKLERGNRWQRQESALWHVK